LELLRQKNWIDEEVKKMCVFTTHTPIKAGHETFSYQLVYQVLGDLLPWHIKKLGGENQLNMTLLALNLSHYANGVAKKHKEVSQKMFPDFKLIRYQWRPSYYLVNAFWQLL
jgi:starch phosphorylase